VAVLLHFLNLPRRAGRPESSFKEGEKMIAEENLWKKRFAGVPCPVCNDIYAKSTKVVREYLLVAPTR
jgi:hypothetical protein